MNELDLSDAEWRRSSHSSADGQCVEVAHLDQWRKSSHSSGDGQCVEVAHLDQAVAVRDSKTPSGPNLIFTRQAWATFIRELKDRGSALG